MTNKLIQFGEQLKEIDPDLSGPPETVATEFLAKNPSYADLIFEELADIITDDVEPDYLVPFLHSNQEMAADKAALVKANAEHITALMQAFDALRALQAGVSVTVLPQIQYETAIHHLNAQMTILNAAVQERAEVQRHLRQLEAAAASQQLSIETMRLTADLTLKLNNAELRNKIIELRELLSLELTKAGRLKEVDLELAHKTLDFKKRKREFDRP